MGKGIPFTMLVLFRDGAFKAGCPGEICAMMWPHKDASWETGGVQYSITSLRLHDLLEFTAAFSCKTQR